MRRESGGFTLVELLVSMVILSLIMVGLLGALRSVGVTGERIDAHLRRSDDLQLAAAFLRQALSRVLAEPRMPGVQASQPPPLVGGGSELVWVGAMPARFGVGGLYRFRLSLEVEGPQPGLHLQFLPYQWPATKVDWGSVESRLLLPEAERLQLRFLGGEPGDGWVAGWQHAERLPQLVSVSWTVAGRGWPSLIVRPATHSAAGSSAGFDAFTVGGRSSQ